MISASSATIFSLCMDVVLAIFAAALIFLALWRNMRRRSNQFFALTMFLLGLYGLSNVPLHLMSVFKIAPEVLFTFGGVVYALAVLATVNFLLSFAGPPYAHWWGVRLLGVPLGAWVLWTLLRGKGFTELTPLANGDYYYEFTPSLLVGMALSVFYLAGVAWTLRRSEIPRAREAALPAFVMVLGVASLTVAARLNFHRYSPNVIALTVAVILLGHVLLKYQVFLPLEQLNAQLERQNAELQVATQAKAQFLANMSHDLRTPLNSILGSTRVFLAGTYGEPTEEQEVRLQRILRNGQHLLTMINDVLAFSRIDARQLKLYRTRVDTEALLDALADEFEPEARAKGVLLVRAYGSLTPLYVDEERVRRVLGKLLSNALRFTESGAIIIRGHYDPLQERVVISVTDTGTGISPEAQKRLFKPLVPSTVDLSERPEGIGLGLYITKKLVELHSGRIWYETTVGQGSTFYVALPAHEVPVYSDLRVNPQRSRNGRAVLIVASDPEDAARFQRVFAAAKIDAYGTACAHTALQMAHEMRPSLIVLEEALKRMSSTRFLLAVCHDPATKHTPILLLSKDALPLFPLLPNVRAWLPRDAPVVEVLSKARALLEKSVVVEATP